MNLRRVGASTGRTTLSSSARMSTLNFRIPSSILGNIGEDLDIGELGEGDDEWGFAMDFSVDSRETLESDLPVAGPSESAGPQGDAPQSGQVSALCDTSPLCC